MIGKNFLYVTMQIISVVSKAYKREIIAPFQVNTYGRTSVSF